MLNSYSQPRGFSIFFLTEMWERYGFYVIQTLLVFYLLDKMNLNDNEAYVIVGSFTALAYTNSFFGGLIADKFIGMSKTVLLGGIFLIIGYGLLSIANGLVVINFGLSCVAIGSGLLKPNISSMLGNLYSQDQPLQRSSGYTMYCIGIYFGVLLGSFIGGYLKRYFGFSFAYLSATLGGMFAVITFLIGQFRFNLVDSRIKRPEFLQYLITTIVIIILISTSFLVLNSEFLSQIYFGLFGLLCLGYIIYHIKTSNGLQRRKLIVFLILILLSICYWGIYFQQFFSISLCLERSGKTLIPSSVMPSVESFGVIVFGMVINYIWYRLGKQNKSLSITAKFSLGFLFNSICFLLLLLGLMYSMYMKVRLYEWIIVVAYLLVAIGEVCIYPTSLAMVSSLVPRKLESVMMGISLLSIGFGGKLAGIFARSSALSNTKATLIEVQGVYLKAFSGYFLFSCITFIFSLYIIKYVRKLASI